MSRHMSRHDRCPPPPPPSCHGGTGGTGDTGDTSTTHPSTRNIAHRATTQPKWRPCNTKQPPSPPPWLGKLPRQMHSNQASRNQGTCPPISFHHL